MGTGRLKRIAALTSLATTSVMVAGVVNVPALVDLPDPTVTTTVPSTTVTVPSTPVTPPTTVTTPTVTTPTVKTPTVTTPTVKTPTVKTPTVKTPSGTQSPTSGGSGDGGGGGDTTIKQQTSAVLDTVSGVTSGGSTTNTVSGVKGTVGGAAGGGSAGVGGTAGGTNPALEALSAFDGGGGRGGTAGPAGSGFGGGTLGGGSFGGPGGAGGGLPPTLSAAGAKRLRAALELLEACLPAIAPIDRRVLSMRAGAAGVAPLSRRQVASQLGVSARQVRFFERRGLSGLRTAAEQTGCAGPVGGPFAVSRIGALGLVAFGLGAGGGTGGDGAAGGGGSGYVPARQAEPGVESPLARLTGSGGSGPAWLVVLVTVLLSVSIAGLMRELRDSVGA